VNPHESAPSGARWDFRTDRTLLELLALNAAQRPSGIALREKDRGIWQQTTWADWLEEVLCCAAGLESLGFGPGSGLVVLGDNRPHLYSGMLAAGALRGHAMPVYPDATPDEIRHVVEQSGASFVLAEDQEQVDKMLDLRESCPHIEHVLYDDPRGMGAYTDAGLLSWNALIAQGQSRLQADPALRMQLLQRARPDDVAVFIHSSGTTGKPKGVVLTHSNVLSGVANAYRAKAFDFGEEVLAYLPMAWIGDFAMTVGAGIGLHFTINIPESAETVLHNLREIAPTFYLAAPRSWDNMLTMVQVRMEDSTPLKKALYHHFMNAALRIERHKLAGGSSSLIDQLTRWVGEWLVYGPIKDQLGLSRLRHAFTGGEAIGEDTFVFYRALGVKLRQLYGQTETSAFNAMQDVDEVRLHTVGRPLPGVEVRIHDDGEILIRSGSVFAGYYRNEESTRNTLRDGWLHTGDAGYLEADGHLVVLGRLSEVVYTAQGERYIPNYIENRLKFSPYIKDVAVLGSGRDTLAAMVCIDMESVGHWAELRGLSYMSYADLSQKAPVMDLLIQAVQRLNATLPEPLQLRALVSLPKEFDADDGEITRTRKLRRNVVEERYAPIIEAIYAGQVEVTYQARIVYETGEVGVLERQLAIRKV
jgi:long-chain acyl-CoA synthetase